MRLCLMAGVLGLLLLSSGGAVGREQTPARPAKSAWLTDYKQARETARRTGKPLFVVFRCVP